MFFLPHPVNSIFSWDKCSSCGSFRKDIFWVITSKKKSVEYLLNFNKIWHKTKVIILSTQTRHYKGEIPENYHTFASSSILPKRVPFHDAYKKWICPQINECREHFKRKGSSSSLIIFSRGELLIFWGLTELIGWNGEPLGIELTVLRLLLSYLILITTCWEWRLKIIYLATFPETKSHGPWK